MDSEHQEESIGKCVIFCVIFMRLLKISHDHIIFLKLTKNQMFQKKKKKKSFSKQTTIVKRESKKRTIVKTDKRSHFGF